MQKFKDFLEECEDIQELMAHENESAEEHAHHAHGPLPDLLKAVSAVLVVLFAIGIYYLF